MASIQSLEVQHLREGIVSPLMEMMGTLSAEMRKNLTEEVSSIRIKLDEVDSKIDYLIDKLEGNNYKTKGEQTYVPDSHDFIPQSDSDDYCVVSGASPKDIHRTERALENTAQLQPAEVESNGLDSPNVSSSRSLERSDTALDQKYEIRNHSPYNLNEESYNNGNVSKMIAESQVPNSAMNGYTTGRGEGSEAGTIQIKEETNEHARNKLSEADERYASDTGRLERPLENVEQTLAPPKDKEDDKDNLQPFNETIVNFAKKESDTVRSHLNPEEARHAEEVATRRQGSYNFGNAETHIRPKSPLPTRASKEKVPYTTFRKTKTEFVNDNRKTYLDNAFNIQHTDVGKQRASEGNVDNSLRLGSKGQDQRHEDRTLKTMPVMHVKGANQEDVRAQDTSKDQAESVSKTSAIVKKSTIVKTSNMESTSKMDKTSNNQQLAPSGFKNEHGDEDNRFLAAAHEEISHASITCRSLSLSNLQLVKNGPRRPLEPSTTEMESGTRTRVAGAVGGSHHPVVSQKQEANEKLVPDEVLYSLIEQERLSVGNCSDVKSQGIDTVICLDTSSSMAGQPIRTAVDTIRKLIDGFENNAIYSDLEENVAIVTFGKENKILCHLTNDYTQLRDSLVNVTAGGPSPLWLGLALSLAEIKERGGACKMDPMTVMPRIILVTDGYASRKNLLQGDDSNDVDSQVVREILSLLSTCRSFTSHMECITLGPCKEEIMKTLTDGRMFTPNDVEKLTQFFKVQEEANNLVKKVIDGEIGREEIDEVVQNINLGKKAKEDVQLIVTEVLMSYAEEKKQTDSQTVEDTVTESPKDDVSGSQTYTEVHVHQDKLSERDTREKQPENPAAQQSAEKVSQDPQQDSLTSIDVIDDVKSLLFGTAVVPNPDWVGFQSRQNFTGTVIGTRKRGQVKILWSDGTTDKCKYGVNGQYDFIVSEDQVVDYSEIQIGSVVKRGKDWRWKDQDGGQGSIGVVMKIEGPVLHVIWPHGGQGNYRYGYNKKYDVMLSETRHSEGTKSAWFIQEEEGNWRSLPTEVSDSIEQMYKANYTATFLVKYEEKSMRISIQHLQARDTSTQATYPIERRELSRDQWLATTNEQ